MTAAPDIRLIVTDMDGTLLDEHGRAPEGLWPLLDRLEAAGILFVPASGRQYATLADMFHRDGHEGLAIIAENGTLVMEGGAVVSVTGMDRRIVADVIQTARQAALDGHEIGVVLCGQRSAYIERLDEPFRGEAATYYHELREVDDLTAVDDTFLKVAVYDFGSAETGVAPRFEHYREVAQVVISGQHWVDLMPQGADKGRAVRAVQAAHGITPAQTAAFGDFLNDLQMLDAAEWSFAMADAHPEVVARARYRAGSHRAGGVLEAIERLLAGDVAFEPGGAVPAARP